MKGRRESQRKRRPTGSLNSGFLGKRAEEGETRPITNGFTKTIEGSRRSRTSWQPLAVVSHLRKFCSKVT